MGAGGNRIDSLEPRQSMHGLHIGRVKSLCARLDLELDFLALGKGLEAFHADCGEVHENVLTTFLFNETVSLGIVEPFYLPSGHCELPPTGVNHLSYDGPSRQRWRGAYIGTL